MLVENDHVGQHINILELRAIQAAFLNMQYAEGHRITSYFSLGKIRDGDQTKDIWLWTTSVGLGEDHDFDGYRVFTWSLRHHRYETAFIQRREEEFCHPGEAGRTFPSVSKATTERPAFANSFLCWVTPCASPELPRVRSPSRRATGRTPTGWRISRSMRQPSGQGSTRTSSAELKAYS